MNHSFYSVDRTTHLKIVALALIGATAVTALSITAHYRGDRMAQTEHASIVRARMPAVIASNIQLAAH